MKIHLNVLGMTTVGMIYVSEISHSSYKQLFLSLNSVFFSGGVLLSTSIVQLEWNIINYTFIGLTIVNIGLIIVNMPESPIWILKFKSSEHVGEARTAMKQIYPKNKQVYYIIFQHLLMIYYGKISANQGDIASQKFRTLYFKILYCKCV